MDINLHSYHITEILEIHSEKNGNIRIVRLNFYANFEFLLWKEKSKITAKAYGFQGQKTLIH